jgi:hypothetical protein
MLDVRGVNKQMIKIMVTVRNRLEITKKCIEALIRHTKIPHQIYIYDNLTDYRIEDHWNFFCNLYKEGKISQFTCNTNASSFNAFSKVVACNDFGKHHQMDPNRNKCDFLLFMDNDMFVLPNWDITLRQAWQDVKKLKLNNVRVISQLPGGIKYRKDIPHKIAGHKAQLGMLGGSGFWCVKPNFFEEVGFLDISLLVGHNKKHDQTYWHKMGKLNKGKPYILGLDSIVVLNCGGAIAGSICNLLTRHKKDPNLNKIIVDRDKEKDEQLSSESFEDFYKRISTPEKMRGLKQW